MLDFRRLCLALSIFLLAASACRTDGLEFRLDDRIEVTHPPRHSTVELPVLLRWKVNKPLGPRTEYFVVFVDTIPPGPGKPLSILADKDEDCKNTPGCPDRVWFETHGVYQTEETSLKLDFIPDNRLSSRPNARDLHEVTVALFDKNNVRIGEAVYWIDLFVKRRSGSA